MTGTALSGSLAVEAGMDTSADLGQTVRDYHQRTKHHLDRYAAGPGTLDWDAQPDPFRHWTDTETLALPRELPRLDIAWPALPNKRPAAPLTVESLSTLLRLSVGITAWKEYAGSRWALRAHPSSGNLHPTETWVIASGVQGVSDGLHHYHSRLHRLERRAWGGTSDTPGLWLGFSSIPWREAWKYGERAFRYCQLDLGHVLAAVSYAAALLGWRAQLSNLESPAVAACLGLDRTADFSGVEAEEPEIIVAFEASAPLPADWSHFAGQPSLLDPRPLYAWPVIEEVTAATRGAFVPTETRPPRAAPLPSTSTRPAGEVILTRRSAQAFDGKSVLSHATFRRLLSCLLPGASPVWNLWPHAPRVHPVLLVHRVEDVVPGLYALPRSDATEAALREALRSEFTWQAADRDLPLFQLMQAGAAKTARTLSCHQDIASHSAFTLMFVAEFAAPIAENPAAYRALHWEAGMLGHVVTLEAEAAGWRGTGIGCFFDDADHEVLGLSDTRFQVLYHFAVGMPVDDSRLLTLPAYA
ncbi:nitroreductase family protein [Thiobacillus sp.]|uniref:nitroreductase family protein n=1 Tax=Thiobacillus sp. TaxID=924 RepID=UPI0025F490FB|nr:nitroreductase family protein [Thiobacillus sp.]